MSSKKFKADPRQLTLPFDMSSPIQEQSPPKSAQLISTEASPIQDKRALPKEAAALLKVHAAWAELLSTTPDLIEVTLAVATSLPVSRALWLSPLWLLLVGAPSSGKTEAVSSLKNQPNVYFLDTLTENAFITGYIPAQGEPQDLLAVLDNQCLVIKDFSTPFLMREESVRKILGDMLSIHDGFFIKFTGTRGKIGYEAMFAFLGCITPIALRRHHTYMTIIGNRFLQYFIPPLTAEEEKEGFEIVWEGGRELKIDTLRRSVGELLQILKVKPYQGVEVKKEVKDYLERLSIFLSRGRSPISWAKVGSNYEIDGVQKEEPWRIFNQLRVFAESLTRLHGRRAISNHELELTRRVVLSSIPEGRREVLRLYQNPAFLTSAKVKQGRKTIKVKGLTVSKCAEGTGKSYPRARELLDELVRIGIMEQKGKTKKGELVYTLKDEFGDIISKPEERLDHFTDLAAPIQPSQEHPEAHSSESALYSTPQRGNDF